MSKKRVINTFPSENIKMPTENGTPIGSLCEYSLRRGYGLEL